MFSPSYPVAQHKVSIAHPTYLTFFYTTFPALPTGITYVEPLNSYHLGTVQHFSVQTHPFSTSAFEHALPAAPERSCFAVIWASIHSSASLITAVIHN